MTDVNFEGIVFSLPDGSEKLPYKAIREMYNTDVDEVGRMCRFVEALAPDEAFGKFLDRNPTMEDFGRLSEAILKVYGFESAGESSGSGDSSMSTAEPSPPTSDTSTASASLTSVHAP